MRERYVEQVRLLMRLLPAIAAEEVKEWYFIDITLFPEFSRFRGTLRS